MTSEEWIFSIVDAFYDKAKTDILIGYHFRNIHNFDEHIPRIAIFWEVQLLGSSQKKISHPFDMMGAHLPLKIKRGELGRWLLLFRKTMQEKQQAEFQGLAQTWEEKLKFFESVFLRFLST